MKTAEELYHSMFKRRLDARKDWEDSTWKCFIGLTLPKGKDKIVAKIQELLDGGCKVKTGWIPTAVRGWHDYTILYKEKENGKEAKESD